MEYAKAALGADIVLKIQPPQPGEIEAMAEGAVLFAMLDPCRNAETLDKLAGRGVIALAFECGSEYSAGLENIPAAEGRDWRKRFLERWKLRRALADFLVEEKALATVGISSRDGGLVRVMGGGSRETGENPGVPAVVMAAEQYNWIVRLLGEPPQQEPDDEAAA